mmetsp:Transcript_13915/g.29212  ORF Transcript_13915/g.29212 Transcript_13915/m.29212 type:complete len:205 (+) Transcript_13915:61-675(+)
MKNKTTSVLLSLFLAAAVPVAVADDQCQTIYEVACETDGLENYCGLVGALGLANYFDSQEDLTVFAPINEAVTKLDFIITDEEKLKEVVLFSVSDGALFMDDLQCEGGSNLLRMASGKDSRTICEKLVPTYQKGGGNMDWNKPKIVSPNIKACNGVVHMVDTVLLPGGFEKLMSDEPLDVSEASQYPQSSWYTSFAAIFLFMYL